MDCKRRGRMVKRLGMRGQERSRAVAWGQSQGKVRGRGGVK